MTQERLELLELKLAYLERANTELSDVVYRQQQTLDALRARVEMTTSRFEQLLQERPWTAEEERPPHY